MICDLYINLKCIYSATKPELSCQHVQRKIGEDFDIGANASAEEASEGTEEAMESGVDLVLNHRLVETGFGKKADYMNYLKDYMKRVVAYLESNNKADQVDGFKKNINGVMKSLLGKFNDLQFYTGSPNWGRKNSVDRDFIQERTWTLKV